MDAAYLLALIGCQGYHESGICKACLEGLEFNQVSKRCEPVCQYEACSKNEGCCTLCLSGFYLDKGCCYSQCDEIIFKLDTNNLECIEGYKINFNASCDPVCLFEVPCAERKSNGYCVACLKNYRFDLVLMLLTYM